MTISIGRAGHLSGKPPFIIPTSAVFWAAVFVAATFVVSFFQMHDFVAVAKEVQALESKIEEKRLHLVGCLKPDLALL